MKFYKHTIIAKTNQRNSQICKKYLYMDFKYKSDGPFLSKWFPIICMHVYIIHLYYCRLLNNLYHDIAIYQRRYSLHECYHLQWNCRTDINKTDRTMENK